MSVAHKQDKKRREGIMGIKKGWTKRFHLLLLY